MAELRDLTGQTFGRWTVIERANHPGNATRWRCRCDCGTVKTVLSDSLVNGRSKSCGCLMPQLVSIKRRTHGQRKTPIYEVWKRMIRRCKDPSKRPNRNHAGRGISVCDRWKGSFEAFIGDMGPRPSPRHQIDRIDQDGDYGPGNCRWVTPKENSRNKRNNHLLTAFGVTKTMMEWSEDPRCKVPYHTLKRRVNHLGWDHESAISAPLVDPCGEKIQAFGEAKSLAEWSRDPRCVARYSNIKTRIRKFGWDPERAMTTPPRPMKRRAL